MSFLTLRPSDPISPWGKKRTGVSQSAYIASHSFAMYKHHHFTPGKQCLKEETGFGMPLEIPPHVRYILIGLLFSPLQLNSPSLQQNGVPPIPVPRHAIWSLLSHLLSFQPWNTLDKKKKENPCVSAWGSAGAEAAELWGSCVGNGQVRAPPALPKINECKELSHRLWDSYLGTRVSDRTFNTWVTLEGRRH